ncbi:MAG: hypothetical protein Q9219_007634 [cf. Caloplaca sp. 3 TL-2023]
MASGNWSAQGHAHSSSRPNPGQLQTRDVDRSNQRFSWQDTPLETQRPTFQQSSSPTNSTIDESPISPLDENQVFPTVAQGRTPTEYSSEKPPVERTNSPYGFPAPTAVHPAYFAPIVEDHKPQQHEPQHPSPGRRTGSEEVKSSAPVSVPGVTPHQPKGNPVVIKSETDQSTLVYNPNSLAGPNAPLENHRPGQVAHPNAVVEPEWKHGLCELDTLCCVGLCCPCIVYGKTQYRISRKTQKEDPTNMLGYESCNGSCGLMALACGFQCK